jgi:hypothetical protein
LVNKNITERIVAPASPATIAHQIPIPPNMNSNKNKNPIWNNKVLTKEHIADIVPLFKAVKKLEVNIDIPINKKLTEYIFIASVDSSNNSLDPLENI